MAHIKSGFPLDEGHTWATCDLCDAHRYKRVELRFDNGAIQPSVGEVLTGGSSGDQATVIKVTLEGGSWAGGDAYGTIELSLI